MSRRVAASFEECYRQKGTTVEASDESLPSGLHTADTRPTLKEEARLITGGSDYKPALLLLHKGRRSTKRQISRTSYRGKRLTS